MPVLKYSTSVPVARTISELQTALAKQGAAAITTLYDAGKPSGLAFTLVTVHGPRGYSLPVNVDAVHQLLRRQSATNARVKFDKAQAERVAWRIVRDWLLAQLALIEAELAVLDQVMLPYLVTDDGRSLYEAYKASEQAALEAGAS